MRPWFELTRVRLSPTAVSNVWLGTALTVGSSGWPFIQGLVLGLLAWVLYLFGMAMNDFADRERDRSLHPERVLPRGELHPRAVARGLLLFAFVAVGLGLSLGWITLGVSIVIMGLITAYNFATKDHRFWGPITMGSVRGGLVLLGATHVSVSAMPTSVWIAASGLGGYVALVTYYSLAEELQNPRTLRRRAELVRAWVIGLAVVAVFSVHEDGSSPWLGIAAWIGALAWSTRAIAPLGHGGPPFLTTLRFLRGLFTLDMAMALTYDLAELALASAVLAITTLPARRS